MRAWTPFVGWVGLAGFFLGAVWRPEVLRGGAGVGGLLVAVAGLMWSRFHAAGVLRRHERGAEGEERVGNVLERLPGGWRVFHGVPGARGDVDHVLMGPPGLCVVETVRWNGRVEVREGRLWDGDRAYPGYELSTLRDRSEEVRARLGEDAVPVWTLVAVAGGRWTRSAGEVEGVWIGEPEVLNDHLKGLPPANLSLHTQETLTRKIEDLYHDER